MESKKVSVIVPLYNVEGYVRDCCKSIMAQEYTNLEVIFVDDCGNDSTMAVLQAFLKENPGFPPCQIRHHEVNRGLSAARNTGLKAASGEYVLFLDSDDMLTPNCIADLAKAIEGCDVAIGEVQEAIEPKEPGSEPLTYGHRHTLQPGVLADAMASYARGEWYVMAWNKLCSRSFLIDNDLWFEEGLLHEDMLWSLQLACARPRITLVDRVTYLYRIRQQSIMTSMSIEKDLAVHVQVFTKMKQFVEANGLQADPSVYALVEGKKSQVLYSLLQGGHYQLFKQYYPKFHVISYISPLSAFKAKMISAGYLLRDFGYCLPGKFGGAYKRMFYNLAYKWQGKKIKGALWTNA